MAEPDDLDLHIRSVTNLLSNLRPQVGEPVNFPLSEKNDGIGKLLDLVALLFVLKDKADVAVVAVKLSPTGIELFDVVDAEEREPLTNASLYVSKNSMNLSGLEPPDIVTGWKWCTQAWLKGPFDATVHGSVLQALARNVSRQPNSKARADAYFELECYVYYQCAPRLYKRLAMPCVLGSAHAPKQDFIRSLNQVAEMGVSLSEEQIQQLSKQPGDPKRAHRNETALAERIQNTKPMKQKHRLQMTGTHLRLDKRNAGILLKYISALLTKARDTVHKIISYRCSHSQAVSSSIEVLKKALKQLCQIMAALQELTFGSITMWRVFHSLPFTDQLYTQANIVLETISQTAADDADEDADEDSAAIIAASTNRSDAFMHWLKSVCAWRLALHDPAFQRILGAQNFQIVTIISPVPPGSHRQAPLKSTLERIPWKYLDITAEEALKQRAEDQLKAHPPPASGNPRSRANVWLACQNGIQDDLWEGMSRAKVHCESELAWRMDPRCQQNPIRDCKPVIGVSARCCYACNLLIDLLQSQGEPSRTPTKLVRATHGKVYPWTPPPGVPTEVKKAILDTLVAHLAVALAEGRTSEDRDSASVGSSGYGSPGDFEMDELENSFEFEVEDSLGSNSESTDRDEPDPQSGGPNL